MADVAEIVRSRLDSIDVEEDILAYLASIIEDLSPAERKSNQTIYDIIHPFLFDSGIISDEKDIKSISRDLSVSFGGSGMQTGTVVADSNEPSTPQLLSAPLKMIDAVENRKVHRSGYMDMTIYTTEENEFDTLENNKEEHVIIAANGNFLDIKAVPITQKQLRKQRKENEQLQRILRSEAEARLKAEQELAAARMAAIKASRKESLPGNANKRSGSSGAPNTNSVTLDHFSVPHPSGRGDLLSDTTLTLTAGRIYGLIGNNGVGKSTLLRQLGGYKADGIQHLRILLVDQHIEGDDDSALQWVLRADVERTALLEEEKKLEYWLYQMNNNKLKPSSTTSSGGQSGNANKSAKKSTKKEKTASYNEETTSTPITKESTEEPQLELLDELVGVDIQLALSEVYDRMQVINVHSAEQRAVHILQGLGFDDMEIIKKKPTKELSGGWAMRAALATALYLQPDLLLLDEPTNHLDLHALVWLEEYLQKHFHSIAIVVSHDSQFLASISSDILEMKHLISSSNNPTASTNVKLTHYSGDYHSYMQQKLEARTVQRRLRRSYEKEREKLQEFISREGKKYDNPAHQAQRKMKVKQLEKLMEVEKVDHEARLELIFPRPYCTLDKEDILVSLQGVAFGWPSQTAVDNAASGDAETVAVVKREDLLFENVNLVVRARSRIAILGKNGMGKTCLLNIMTGELDALAGSVHRHPGHRITMLQQHHYKGEQLEPGLTAVEHIRKLPMSDTTALGLLDLESRHAETAIRGYLAQFDIFSTRATIPVRHLSGGQRVRVALAVAFYRKPDLLFLDEPTNHLDTDTSRALCAALAKFEGAIVLVSHDESFVEQVLSCQAPADWEEPDSEDESESRIPISKPALTKDEAFLRGELQVIQQQGPNKRKTLQRFDGSFKEYKQSVAKSIYSSLQESFNAMKLH